MVQINFASREVNCKIVYYGPGRCGKTTNLQVVHARAPKGSVPSDMVSIATETDRTLYFDFLPLDLGKIAGMTTKFQLYTVPGQVYYDATRRLVLQGADGVVFVADSNPQMMKENIESLENLERNLAENGLDMNTVPLVMQWNKRDLPDAVPIEEMERQLNRRGWPSVAAVAVTGEGVMETLKLVAQEVIRRLNRQQGYSEDGQRRAEAARKAGAVALSPPRPPAAAAAGRAATPPPPPARPVGAAGAPPQPPQPPGPAAPPTSGASAAVASAVAAGHAPAAPRPPAIPKPLSGATPVLPVGAAGAQHHLPPKAPAAPTPLPPRPVPAASAPQRKPSPSSAGIGISAQQHAVSRPPPVGQPAGSPAASAQPGVVRQAASASNAPPPPPPAAAAKMPPSSPPQPRPPMPSAGHAPAGGCGAVPAPASAASVQVKSASEASGAPVPRSEKDLARGVSGGKLFGEPQKKKGCLSVLVAAITISWLIAAAASAILG